MNSGGVSVPESPVAESPYITEDKHFFKCLETGQNFLVNTTDALNALRIALGALESIDSDNPVELGGSCHA
jgi:predicted dehydrogenase